MPEADYTNREIDTFENRVEKGLGEIIKQARLTNNRVRSLELWRSYMLGGMSALTLIVIPLVIWFVKHWGG